MRVAHLMPDVPSHAVNRVVAALEREAPTDTEWTPHTHTADLLLLHVIGRRDRMLDAADLCRRRGQRYAVLQYVLRSSQRPSTADWVGLWQHAAVTMSYYDLPALCREDGVRATFPFYEAPLGADAAFDVLPPKEKSWLVLTSGRHWLTESTRECILAARAVGQAAVQLGHVLKGRDVQTFQNMTDASLATLYGRCHFVSGLRRTEGFELPAAEGLCCGARPILFEQPHYRRWYDGLGVFIPERPRAEVLAGLTVLFRQDPRPVTNRERSEAHVRFAWPAILAPFWERVA